MVLIADIPVGLGKVESSFPSLSNVHICQHLHVSIAVIIHGLLHSAVSEQ